MDRFHDAVECRLKILSASTYHGAGECAWIIHLEVGKGQPVARGWVFVDRTAIEVRFEQGLSLAPPGFLSGVYRSQRGEDSSLSCLFDDPYEHDISRMEHHIRRFVDTCRFCVRSLTDLGTGKHRQVAFSYRYGCAVVPILNR